MLAQVRLENEGASTTCLRILPDKHKFPIGSGIENGVELLLDLEAFDNGEFGVNEDGLKILVTDEHDYPLLDLNGFTVKPGVATNIKIRPVLFDATAQALENFDDYNRRCVDARNPELENLLQGMHLPYSLSNCLLAATLEKAYQNCSGIFPHNRYGLMNASGLTLGCLNG